MAHQSDLEKFIKWVDHFDTATASARKAAENDRDYVDGKQWSAEEIRRLGGRGQAPVVVNIIQKKVNHLKGAEIRTRVDPNCLPRTPHHDDDAIVATDALRYLKDREDLNRKFTRNYDNLLVEGYCGAVVDAELFESGPEVRVRGVPWDRLLYDPASRENDFSDALYLGVVVWMDTQEAIAAYDKNPQVAKGADKLITAAEGADRGNIHTFEDRPRNWGDKTRERVKIVELYYRHGGEWYTCHFVSTGMIVEPRPTGLVDEYGKNVCPLIMASANTDRENRRYGAVRPMIWSQDELNKRRSKALHLSNTRQIIAEVGAVKNVQTAQNELAKPDGYIEVNEGALTSGAFSVSQTGDLAAAHFQLMAESKAELDMLGSSSQAMLADDQARSGRAEIERHRAATMELEPLFDNLRGLQKRVYEALWQRVRQFWTEEKWLRVRDDKERKGWRFVAINRPMTRLQRIQELIFEKGVEPGPAFGLAGWPEGAQIANQIGQQIAQAAQQGGMEIGQDQAVQLIVKQMSKMPQAQEQITSNDVATIETDIVLDVIPDVSVIQHEQFQQLAQLAQNGIPIPPDVLLEASDLRNKRQLIEAIKSASQPDPQAAELQAQMQQLQTAMIQVQIQVGQAQAAKLAADAQKSAAQTQKTMTETRLAPEIAQHEGERDQAQAMKSAAEAGAISGGADSPDTAFD